MKLLILPFLILCISLYLVFIDLKKGIVPNRVIFPVIIVEVIIQFVLFLLLKPQIASVVKVVFFFVLASLLYFMNIWGAGDSKIFSAIILSYVIVQWDYIPIVSLSIIPIIAFLSGYLFCMIKLIISLFNKTVQLDSVFSLDRLLSLLTRLSFTGIVSIVFFLILKVVDINNLLLQFIIILCIDYVVKNSIGKLMLKRKSNWLWFSYPIIIIAEKMLGLSIFPFIITSIVLFLSDLLNSISYKNILLKELKPGMVLSSYSRMLFEQAGVLEISGKYERVADKLTDGTVAQIIRWGEKKNQMNLSVSIVNTVPFVSFIFIGDLFYFIWMACDGISFIL